METSQLRRFDADQILLHEYGHAVQYQDLGPQKYACAIIVPSLIGYGISEIWPSYNDNYFRQPWENWASLTGNAESMIANDFVSRLIATIYKINYTYLLP